LENLKRRDHLEYLYVDEKITHIKIDLREIECDSEDRIREVQDRDRLPARVNMVIHLRDP
jgi:hypothetical protein